MGGMGGRSRCRQHSGRGPEGGGGQGPRRLLFSVMAMFINCKKLGLQSTTVESAIVTGFVAVAVIYSFGDISGAHFPRGRPFRLRGRRTGAALPATRR